MIRYHEGIYFRKYHGWHIEIVNSTAEDNLFSRHFSCINSNTKLLTLASTFDSKIDSERASMEPQNMTQVLNSRKLWRAKTSRFLLVKNFAVHNSLLSALVQNTSLKENVLVGNVILVEYLMGYWWK